MIAGGPDMQAAVVRNMIDAPSAARQEFRDAMARLGAAVNIVTTDGPGGRAGFTASAVCSVTDAPPTMLVCLNRGASAYPHVIANRAICVNVLGDGHEPLSALFGGKTPQNERFSAASWIRAATGSPVLVGAVAALDCRITEIVSVSTHDILICAVEQIDLDPSRHGLVYFDRRYHVLETGTAGQ
jgi:flavin reductase